MGSRRRRLDPVGPFGNPDGSRADIEDLISEFVDFGGDPAYGHLATRANDSMVRVIVGKLGAGKTVYLRRLQDFQAHQDSVFATPPQQSLPKTEVVVKACQWFSDRVLVEKWMQIWERAILRSLASHLLCHPDLRQQVSEEQATEIRQSYTRLLDDFRRPRSIYSEVRDIINLRHTAHQLSTYLDDPLWDDLEDLLGEVVGQCRPIYFYLDALDEEFSHAPMYWLKCQEGLFYQVMRMLRDHRLGGRLHIVVCIRDIVMSSVYRSEHAPRYYNEPHIRVLTWDRSSLLYLLRKKLQRLPPSLLMRRAASGPPTIGDWLGVDGRWPGPDGDETIEDYLLNHTRLIPRDIISLGNELNEEVLRQKQAGHAGLPPEALQAVVQRCAKRFGDSQLAQCANQISSDLMPAGAALHDYSDLFTSTQAYITGVQEDVRSFVRLIGVDRFSRADLEALQEVADLHFEKATDLASVLWQNGLLGYIDEAGQRRFYSLGDIEEFHFPPDVSTYVLHPCLVHTVGGIRYAQADPTGAGASPAPIPGRQTGYPLRPGQHTVRETAELPGPPVPTAVPAPTPADYAVGDILEGRFEILGLLGRGSFSKVYRVRDDVENAERALKLFDGAAGGGASGAAVRREIGALRKIQHPHVVQVFWAGQTSGGDWYLVTEFIDGESLDEFVTGPKRLRDREAVDVALDLLDALVSFHPDAARLGELDAQRRDGGLTEAESREWAELTDNGLVHRDIKPLNVMLTRTGAKLLDFNIASRVGDPVHTQSGTPPYQPPDAGRERWDVSTDLFAVGVLLYRLLCNGHHPFPHARPLVGVPVTDPSTIRPDLDPALAGFLLRACAPARADRFATAADMRLALRHVRTDLLPNGRCRVPREPRLRSVSGSATLGAMKLHVGCAMWTYAPWQGRYLPASLSPRERLSAYATWCNAVEGNTTFYATPALDTVTSWAAQTAPDFRFVLKLPKTVTHERRLADVADPLRAFLAAIEPLGERAHALWVQLPPSFSPAELGALAGFLRRLPPRYRYCVEVRHREFFDDPRAGQQLERALAAVGAEWVPFDTTVLFGSPPTSDAEREAWTKKPRLPRRSRALTSHPVVRYIGRDDRDRTVAGWRPWLGTVAGWLREGRSPTVFIHTPDNVEAPALARRFHDEVRAQVPGLEPLPEPIPAGPPTLF